MGYTRKAQAPQTESNIDWNGFNKHLVEQIGATDSRIAKVCGIVDIGKQARKNFEEAYDPSKEEHTKAIEERGAEVLNGEYFNDKGKKVSGEYISIPQNPVEQVVVFVAFPEIMINYGKFFDDSGEDRFEPYVCPVGGDWWDKNAGEKGMKLAKGIPLSCTKNDKAKSGWAYSPNNTISKLGLNGVDKDGNPIYEGAVLDQDFDLGSLLGAVCMYTLGAELSDDKWFNQKIKDCAKKHKAVPVPDVAVPEFGCLWEGGNAKEDLEQVLRFRPVYNAMTQAENWEESGIKAELDALQEERKAEFKAKNEAAKSESSAAKKKVVENSEASSSDDDFSDFEDEFNDDDFDIDGAFDD